MIGILPDEFTDDGPDQRRSDGSGIDSSSRRQRSGGRSAGMHSARVHIGALLLVATVMFVPYAVAGPGIFRDDWFTLRNAKLDGWWMSAGSSQWFARPVGSAIYAVTFGLIGQRPTVHFILAAIVVTATSVVIYRIAARYVPPLAALALAALWLILPNHTSMEMWPSAFNIAVALLLLGLGVDFLTHPAISRRRDWAAAACFGIGLLSYEAIGPAAVAAVLVVGWNRPSGRRTQAVLPSFLTLGAGVAWMILNWHPEKKNLEGNFDPSFVMPAHFGYSITGSVRAAEMILPVTVLLVGAVAAYFLIVEERRVNTGWEERMVVLGWALIVLGTLPFVRYFYAPIGFGDRVLVVSGVGGALVLVGVVALLARWWWPSAVLVALVIFATAIPQRVSMVSDFATAADDSRRILAAVESRWPTPPEGEMVFGPTMIVKRHVVAFEHVDSSLELLYGQRSVDARMATDPDDFYETPPSLRFDLRKYSKLDDGRLGEP